MHTGTALAEPWAQPPGAQQLLAVPWGTEHTEHTAPCSQHCPEHPADRMHEVCRWISSNQSHCRGMHAIAGVIWEFQTLLGVSYGKLTAAQILVHAGVSATNCLPVSHKGSRQWIKFPRLLQVNTRSCSSGKHRVVHWPLHLLLFQSFTSVRTDPWRRGRAGQPQTCWCPSGNCMLMYNRGGIPVALSATCKQIKSYLCFTSLIKHTQNSLCCLFYVLSNQSHGEICLP